MMAPVLLYVDRYHVGDALFLQSLARAISSRRGREPLLLVHGTGEEVGRVFEAAGRFLPIVRGRIEVDSPDDQELLVRATTELTRKISAILTDMIVSSVPLSGADRGLLQAGEAGVVVSGRSGWLADLLHKEVVPVVSLLARSQVDGGTIDCTGAEALNGLRIALGGTDVAFFRGLRRGGTVDSNDRADLPGAATWSDDLVERDIALGLSRRGARVLLASLESVRNLPTAEWEVLYPGTPSEPAKLA